MDGDAAEGAADITLVARRNIPSPRVADFSYRVPLRQLFWRSSLEFALDDASLIPLFAGPNLLVVVKKFRFVQRHAGDCECRASG